jgi:uncharacterized protein YkvS
MSRTVKITKVGKTTIVEITEGPVTSVETLVYNKLTDLTVRNNVIGVESNEHRVLNFKWEEIVDKLASVDAKDYVYKASALFLFNQ